jgi:hypothetical protein
VPIDKAIYLPNPEIILNKFQLVVFKAFFLITPMPPLGGYPEATVQIMGLIAGHSTNFSMKILYSLRFNRFNFLDRLGWSRECFNR